jgi:hypothetical protein
MKIKPNSLNEFFSLKQISSLFFLFVFILVGYDLFSQNFIPNGSLSCGWSYIQTNYTNSGLPNPTQPGDAAITSNPNLVDNTWASFYDHTTGTTAGSMMVINGYTNNSGSMFWKTGTNVGGGNGIPLVGGVSYVFSYCLLGTCS